MALYRDDLLPLIDALEGREKEKQKLAASLAPPQATENGRTLSMAVALYFAARDTKAGGDPHDVVRYVASHTLSYAIYGHHESIAVYQALRATKYYEAATQFNLVTSTLGSADIRDIAKHIGIMS